MSFLSDLLGGLVGGVGGILDNKADSWLNKLLTGEEYAGQKNDKKALSELEELKKLAKEREDPDFQKVNLKPNQVDYNGNLVAPTGQTSTSQNVKNPTASTYNPGTLTNQLAGDAVLADTTTYDPTMMDQIDPYTAAQIQASQIGKIDPYSAALGEAAKIDGAETYDAQMLGQAKKVQDNAALRDMLMGNLGTLQDRSQSGFDQVDRMMNNEVQTEAAKNATRMNDAVTQDLQARGVAGGGSELQRRMAANASAAEQGAKSGTALAAEARNRQDTALRDASSLASSMRSTDIDKSKFDASADNQFSLANQSAANQASQFNTGSKNDVNKQNAAFTQQQNLANQSATNDASQFNKNLDFNTQSKNADLSQNANTFNAGSQNDASQFNKNLEFNTNQANQGAANQAGQFNAGQLNDTSKFNAGTQNDRQEFNTNTQNDANKLNFGAQNDASQFNANAQNNMATNNADRTQNNNQFNAGQTNDMTRFNTGMEFDANKYKLDQQNAESRDNTNINNSFLTSNRDFNYGVDKDNYTMGQNNFTNQLNVGKLLSDYYYNASDRDARLAAAAAAQQGGSGKTGTSGGFLSSLLGGITGGIGKLFGFEDGGMTPEGVPYVVGESGPEWAVNTDQGTAVAPMNTGNFHTDFMGMINSPETGGKPVNPQAINKDKKYHFPALYDLRG